MVVIGVLVVAAGAVVSWAVLSPAGTNGAGIETESFYTVERHSFTMTIPARGELHASKQIEIRNLIEENATITEIVDEGKTVKKGDLLIQLATVRLVDRIKDAQDAVKVGEAAVVAAEQSLAIERSAMESDVDRASLQIELSKLAVQAWEKGELVSKRQGHEISIQTAQINSARLEDRFKDAEKLLAEGFISKDEFELDRIKLIEAQAALKEAELNKTVYETYQIQQDRATLESAVEQNLAEYTRVTQRHEADIVRLVASVESAAFRFQTAEERLAELQRQLDACVLRAPSDGLVVYASSLEGGGYRGRGDEPPPSVGSSLRANELVMILPDTSRMIASMKVGEALSGRITAGQPAIVYSDSLPDTPITGVVEKVSVLAEGGGWRDPNRRDYTVNILLDAEASMGLKPSMRCRGEIVLGEVEDVLSVPIQAVFREGPMAVVYLETAQGVSAQEVELGRASEMEVEVLSGLEEGNRVLVRKPRLGEILTAPASEPETGETHAHGSDQG
jgi:HlyD family secretion protein